jgi:hypothetical protein
MKPIELSPELLTELLASSGSPPSTTSLARLAYAQGARDQLEAIAQWVAAWPWGDGISGPLLAQQIRASQCGTPPAPSAKERAIQAVVESLRNLQEVS